jgi:hypothetical protein
MITPQVKTLRNRSELGCSNVPAVWIVLVKKANIKKKMIKMVLSSVQRMLFIY